MDFKIVVNNKKGQLVCEFLKTFDIEDAGITINQSQLNLLAYQTIKESGLDPQVYTWEIYPERF